MTDRVTGEGIAGALVDGCYRYTLWRRVSSEASDRVLFVMLNPSTADATSDDPTIRRCIDFARRWHFGFLDVCNLFALRTSDPRVLRRAQDPVGAHNDEWIVRVANSASLVVAAWGAHPVTGRRSTQVLSLLDGCTVVCLGTTRSGAPRHPLYVKGTERLQSFP